MPLFGTKTHYDRSTAMEKASKAAGKGKKKKAIDEYEKVLEHEPDNAAVLSKVAVLLAETKQLADAWKSFVAAAEAWKKQGFVDRQYSVYSSATRYLPREVELWETLARIDLERGKKADALQVLLEGRAHFRKRKLRAFAIRLLRQAVKIEPWHFQATFDLAKTLRDDGERAEAMKLLEVLCSRNNGKKLRQARGVLFRMSPTPGNGWRWMRAAIRGK